MIIPVSLQRLPKPLRPPLRLLEEEERLELDERLDELLDERLPKPPDERELPPPPLPQKERDDPPDDDPPDDPADDPADDALLDDRERIVRASFIDWRMISSSTREAGAPASHCMGRSLSRDLSTTVAAAAPVAAESVRPKERLPEANDSPRPRESPVSVGRGRGAGAEGWGATGGMAALCAMGRGDRSGRGHSAPVGPLVLLWSTGKCVGTGIHMGIAAPKLSAWASTTLSTASATA